MTRKIQLFIIPFAGGDSNSFNKLTELLDPCIEAYTVSYAGRGKRRSERLFERYDDFMSDVLGQLRAVRNPKLPFAMLGYSAGSVYTYEILSRGSIGEGLVHTFICAKGSIINPVPSSKWWMLSDEEFGQHMKRLGGIDDRILKDARFRKIYLRPIKADYKLYDQFIFHPGKIPSDITAIYSPKDEIATGVSDWAKLTDGKTDFYPMGDNHFFIKEHWQEVADIVNDHLLGKLNQMFE